MTPLLSLLALPAGWILLFLAALARRRDRRVLNALALLACLSPLATLPLPALRIDASLWGGTFHWDALAMTLTAGILAGTLFVVALARREEGFPHLPFLLLSLALAIGAVAAVSTRDLATALVAIELVSIAGYALAGLARTEEATEAAMKYFLFGAAATGFLVFGLGLLFAAGGTTRLAILPHSGLATAGAALFAAGLLLKAGAAPFHSWVPDVYGGTPPAVAALLSTVSKAAALGLLYRFASAALAGHEALGVPLLWTAAALSMTVGNLGAIPQTDLRRLLAYSSLAHTGYILMGILAFGRDLPAGAVAVGLYLVAYIAMGVGSFGFLSLAGGSDEAALSGLSRRRPLLAATLSGSLLSLAGLPPTLGFAAKVLLIAGAVKAGYAGLAVVAVLNSLVSIYYYLKGIGWMCLSEPRGEERRGLGLEPPEGTLALALLAVLALGTAVPLAIWLWR